MDLKNELDYLKYSVDPIAFMEDILDLTCKDFHKEWVELFEHNENVSLMAPRGHGKELADSTPILTINGWTTHGELKQGDYVFSPSGKPIKILATNEKAPANYIIETRDGESIRCHANHEWFVYDRNTKRYTIKETKNMIGEWNHGIRSRYQLPNTKELEFNKKELPLDPYYLGLWLGDGTSSGSSIVCSESDIATINSIKYNISYKYIHPKTKVLKFGFGNNGILGKLKRLNLYNNKHIPDIYLQSSIEQRLELLAGLIDSDGSLSKKRGRYRFVNTNLNLIKGIEELILSFGLCPYITEQEPHSHDRIHGRKKVYTVNFNANINIPTRLKRKRNPDRVPLINRLGITSVRYEPNGEIGNCIQVDSEDGLYLAGRRLIPTHNSTIVGGYIIWKIVTNPDIRILIVTINQDLANTTMDFVQRHLEGNERLRDVFGQQKGTTDWSRSSMRVVSAKRVTREPTLMVIGVTSSMVGPHFEMVILDDITDQKNSKTEYRRRDLVRWFNNTLMPMVEPKDSKVISIGTKWHQDDIHTYFSGISNYVCKRYQAILQEKDEENGIEPEVLWPERFSYEKLQEIKKSYGNVAFMMQYQNEFISDEESPIKFEWVQSALEGYRNVLPPYDTYIGVDLASKGEESDFFALSVIAVKDGIIYLVDGYRGHISMSQQFQVINGYYAKWQPVRIGIDQAAQQKMIVEDLIEKSPGLPIIPIKSSIVNDRTSRVMRLSVFFEQGRVYINSKLDVWSDELISYPRGAHDDTIDSLSYAIQSSTELDEATVDWDLVADVITARKAKPIRSKSRRFDVIKI